MLNRERSEAMGKMTKNWEIRQNEAKEECSRNNSMRVQKSPHGKRKINTKKTRVYEKWKYPISISWCPIKHKLLELPIFLHLEFSQVFLWKPNSPKDVSFPAVLWSCSCTSVLESGWLTNYGSPSSGTNTSSQYLPECFPLSLSNSNSRIVSNIHRTFYWFSSPPPPTLSSVYHKYYIHGQSSHNSSTYSQGSKGPRDMSSPEGQAHLMGLSPYSPKNKFIQWNQI